MAGPNTHLHIYIPRSFSNPKAYPFVHQTCRRGHRLPLVSLTKAAWSCRSCIGASTLHVLVCCSSPFPTLLHWCHSSPSPTLPSILTTSLLGSIGTIALFPFDFESLLFDVFISSFVCVLPGRVRPFCDRDWGQG